MIGAPVCMVFFLITLYDELSNQEVWKSFLEHAPSEHYRILLHAKAPHKLNLTLMEEFSANIQVIPSVDSAYAKLVKPMAALFRAALNESSHPLDSFHMISSDTIPVKSFNELRGRHCSLPSSQTPDTPLLSRSVVPSQICVAPTDQWASISSGNKDLKAVKTHQWMILNKKDAEILVEQEERYPHFKDIFQSYFPGSGRGIYGGSGSGSEITHESLRQKMNGGEEEFWIYTALFGVYNVSSNIVLPSHSQKSQQLLVLQYPSVEEAGSCPMYVWWPDFPPSSIFAEGGGIPRLTVDKQHSLGSQRLWRPPFELIPALKQSSNFCYLRKIKEKSGPGMKHSDVTERPLHTGGFVLAEGGEGGEGTLLSIPEAVQRARLYYDKDNDNDVGPGTGTGE